MHERIIRARMFLGSDGIGPALVRSVSGTAILRLAAMIASFGVGVQLARGLGPRIYGTYAIALSVITLSGIPSQFGLPKLVVREVASSLAANNFTALFGVLRWAERISLRISFVIGSVLAIGALLLLNTQWSPILLPIVLGAPTIPLLSLAKVKGSALQGMHHIVRGQSADLLLRPLVLWVLLFGASVAGLTITASTAMAFYAIAAAAALLVAHIWLRRLLPKVPLPLSSPVDRGHQWLVSSIPMALADSILVLQSELTTLALGFLASPAEVGLFRIAAVTAVTAAVGVTIVGMAAAPHMAALHAQSQNFRVQKLVTYVARAQLSGVLLLSLPLLIFAEPLLNLAFGSDYAPAAPALRILIIGQIASAIFGPNTPLLNMTGHERRVTRAMALALLVNFTAVAVLGTLWGSIGAAIAVLVSILTWNVIAWRDARRCLSIETAVVGPRFSHPGGA